uniref:Uncharacterized protein n=1 Tax=viral metagenome TaxID=1070528 RepID=A0A6C0APY0_9ZZZZ
MDLIEEYQHLESPIKNLNIYMQDDFYSELNVDENIYKGLSEKIKSPIEIKKPVVYIFGIKISWFPYLAFKFEYK